MPARAKGTASKPGPEPRSSTHPGGKPGQRDHPPDQPRGIGQAITLIKGHHALKAARIINVDLVHGSQGFALPDKALYWFEVEITPARIADMASIALVDDDKISGFGDDAAGGRKAITSKSFSDPAAALTALLQRAARPGDPGHQDAGAWTDWNCCAGCARPPPNCR